MSKQSLYVQEFKIVFFFSKLLHVPLTSWCCGSNDSNTLQLFFIFSYRKGVQVFQAISLITWLKHGKTLHIDVSFILNCITAINLKNSCAAHNFFQKMQKRLTACLRTHSKWFRDVKFWIWIKHFFKNGLIVSMEEKKHFNNWI